MTDPKVETYESEVIEDARTGEEIPVGIQKVQSNTLATSLDLTKAGTIVLDEQAEKVLSEPLNPEDVKIRADGLVYVPWTWYADRLNKAFNRLGWALIPQSGPQARDEGNLILVIWGHWLIVKGTPVGFEIGGCSYRSNNGTMSFDDAAAGAKSNSLARNCKMLGMTLELWDNDWIDAWKEKYAERVKNPKGNRPEYIWRKKAKSSNGVQSQQKVAEPAEVDATEPAKTEEVKATPDVVYEDLTPWTELKKIPTIAMLSEKSGKPKSAVAIHIGKLDHAGSYSISEIVKELKGA